MPSSRAVRPVLAALRDTIDRQATVTAALAKALTQPGRQPDARAVPAAAAPQLRKPTVAGFEPLRSMLNHHTAWTAPYRPPADPLLAAIPYRPATDEEVAARANAMMAGRPVESRLPKLLTDAYRDPGHARRRLDDLVQCDREDSAAERLTREGQGLLGRLRGGAGLLASDAPQVARLSAENAVRLFPTPCSNPSAPGQRSSKPPTLSSRRSGSAPALPCRACPTRRWPQLAG